MVAPPKAHLILVPAKKGEDEMYRLRPAEAKDITPASLWNLRFDHKFAPNPSFSRLVFAAAGAMRSQSGMSCIERSGNSFLA
jgi:hypothetical protein